MCLHVLGEEACPLMRESGWGASWAKDEVLWLVLSVVVIFIFILLS